MRDETPIPQAAYSISQIERALGISHSKLYEVIGSNEPKTFRIGTRRFATPQTIQDFIAAREAEAA